MTVEQKLYTAEELWAMPDADGRRYELVEGELVEVPGAGALHGVISGNMYDHLRRYVSNHRLGVAFGDGVGYILARNPDRVRIPDASFVSRERIPATGLPEGYWPLAPDLAVEIVSPNDSAESLHARVREYLAAGTRLVWVVWPRSRSVTEYVPSGESREFQADGQLSGGEVLPGFTVRVAELFEQDY